MEHKNIKEIAKRSDLVQLFVRSLAPSIEGSDVIKEALLI